MIVFVIYRHPCFQSRFPSLFRIDTFAMFSISQSNEYIGNRFLSCTTISCVFAGLRDCATVSILLLERWVSLLYIVECVYVDVYMKFFSQFSMQFHRWNHGKYFLFWCPFDWRIGRFFDRYFFFVTNWWLSHSRWFIDINLCILI